MNLSFSLSRRKILQGAGAAGVLGLMPAPLLGAALASGRNRMVVIVLRGGMDGLSAAVPYGDAEYYRYRPNIALPRPGNKGGVLRLDAMFGLHPAMTNLHRMWRQGDLAVLPAVSTPDRTRSHFDAQDTLENGMSDALGARDGWLYRALRTDGAANVARAGLSVGRSVPLLMRGADLVRTWAPTYLPGADGAFLDQMQQMYAQDADYSALLASARRSLKMNGSNAGQAETPEEEFGDMCSNCGRLLAMDDGPRIASLELGGWDTHTTQSYFMQERLAQLDDGLGQLKSALGSTWRQTIVVVVSEFGRTVRENGGRGTDHGTGGLALLAGGAVRGGRIATPWPGLDDDQLFENRDLMPETDMRSIMKGVLQDHMMVSPKQMTRIFPGADGMAKISGLTKIS